MPFSSLTDVDNLSYVVNDILIDEISRNNGVFQHEVIDINGSIFIGEKVCNFFLRLLRHADLRK